MSSHSTKNQLKEKSPEAKFILSNTLHALLLFKIQKVQFQCRFRPSVSITRRQCAWLDARSPSLLSGPSHACVEPSWRRWRAGPPKPASSAASGPPVAADRRHTTAERRSAPPIAPWLSAWPHARQRTPAAPSPWPDSAGRALCRQRTRAVPFRPKPALSF